MIKKCLQLNKVPVFYAYIIAFEARRAEKLYDCNDGQADPNHNLCTHGAEFIKNNRALLVSRYTHQATNIARDLKDSNKECLFLMEQDFW